jgi:hypothetical protein
MDLIGPNRNRGGWYLIAHVPNCWVTTGCEAAEHSVMKTVHAIIGHITSGTEFFANQFTPLINEPMRVFL